MRAQVFYGFFISDPPYSNLFYEWLLKRFYEGKNGARIVTTHGTSEVSLARKLGLVKESKLNKESLFSKEILLRQGTTLSKEG